MIMSDISCGHVFQVVTYVEGETAFRAAFELDWFDKVSSCACVHDIAQTMF